MSRNKGVIENPEVPGCEQNLPPPPPGLSISHKNETNTLSPSPNGLSQSFNDVVDQSSQELPWWIPTEADTQDVYSHQWFESQKPCFISPLPPPPPPPPPPSLLPQPKSSVVVLGQQQLQQFSEKNKNKVIKRKLKELDPAEDAERVASAQRELTALMKPLKCDLCNAVMNSTLQAKLHYDGKPHQKKVSMFLNQSVKKIKIEDSLLTGDGNNDNSNSSNEIMHDWNTFCAICKTWFTSHTDATQHYAGKKHIKATTGINKQRIQKKPIFTNSNIDPSGRFGIGIGFQSENVGFPTVIDTVSPENNIQIATSLVTLPPATTYGSALRCDLCGVSANRLEQLETHKRGARHQKMLRLNSIDATALSDTSTLPIPPPPPSPSLPAPIANLSTIIDYSIYRTPSGSYYCAPCNKSFASENSFAQHVESKKHKNQINPKSPVTTATITTISSTKKVKWKK